MDDPTDIFNVAKTLLHVKSTINILKYLPANIYFSKVNNRNREKV